MLTQLQHLPLLILFTQAVLNQAAFASATAETEHTRISLLSEYSRIRSGQSFWLALELTPDPGWHTYWINPGDSGKATKIDWMLTEGLQAGTIHWPYPRRIRTGPLVSFGYTGSIGLLTEITPAHLPAATNKVSIRAKADWLVCREICIPESALLSLDLPIGATAESDPDAVPLFIRTRAQLPEPAAWTGRYTYKDGRLIVDVPVSTAFNPTKIIFYPLEDSLLENAADQSFLLGESMLRFSVNAGYLQHTTPIHGVLVLEHQDVETAEAIEFTATHAKELPDNGLFNDKKNPAAK